VLIAVAPGRALRWSPRWPCSEDSVLFDASSGDFWVLTGPARTLLQAVETDGTMPVSQLQDSLDLSEVAAYALIAGLARAGLVTVTDKGRAVALAQWLDDDS